MATLVIAEAGVNHNGSLSMALELVDAAAHCGADVVKFQSFDPQQIASRHAGKAAYQKRTTDATESQQAMLARLALSVEDHHQLLQRCQQRGIGFLSSPFDLPSLALLVGLGCRPFKIPSGEITNLPLLRGIGATGEAVLLSTGMATLGEVEAAINVLVMAGTPRAQITLLHCTTEYPAPLQEVNLRAMLSMGQSFALPYGYSDHTEGIAIAIAAAALGATVIEKHFTLDRQLPGPDHKASLEPAALGEMVQGIRQVEQAMGDGIKRPTPTELANRPIARKSIVARCAIRAGEPLTAENLTTKRPGDGLSPMYWDELVGRPAQRDYAEDDPIER
ncbi:N-acetylneuraminate synthase [Magnetococcus marinus MC-1]|uniref:N-acetylneuraminate synthase n=1 Tax=Magnetococcus marinus (strain ATCC BAA-1437 / JCM 17883 / MC-1) TaxID=156889 RepID=A0L544_MAGMM|nr:N-acetylneuraminate synthase [Magnetococcus marinus]ABK43087.1 N-acetylneuraminate synthase [Magnetococcus marinus MC-1]